MTKVVDSTEAIKLLEEVRDEKGADYAYTDHFESCVLAAEGEPRCIVGHVYAKVGVPVEGLESMVGVPGSEYYPIDDPDDPLGMLTQSVDFEEEYGIRFTPKALRVLYMAQRRQDSGNTWGVSVERAKAEVEYIKEES